jgi:DNA-binding PadR family transcriptional regulator
VIKRIKKESRESDLNPRSLIATNKELVDYIEKFESEINRGISTLCILSIIRNTLKQGIHGYQISKNLNEQTKEMLVIEEGTLYPILRKLEREGLIESQREEVDGRLRKNYSITENGLKVYDRMVGFFSVLTEAIAPLFDVKVNLMQERYIYCPECANKIEIDRVGINFCEICGHPIQELRERGLKKK